MKTVRFSITNLGGGGAEKILINILSNLSRNKYKLSLFLFEKTGVYLDKIPQDVDLRYFIDPAKLPSWLQPLYGKYLRKILFRLLMYFPSLVYWWSGVKSVDVDIAYLQEMSYLLKVRSKSEFKIVWIHTDIRSLPKLMIHLKDSLINVDQIVCVSEKISEVIGIEFASLNRDVVTIYNPTDIQRIQQLGNLEKVNFEGKTIISVGRLSSEKGLDVLLDSFKKLIDEGCIYTLVILGDGPLRDELKHFTKKLNIEQRVKFVGFKDNPYPYIKNADLFVLSSHREGLPGALIEALALGTPIVSTDCIAGPREILKDGQCGLLVPVDDAEALAKAIKEVLENPSLAKDFSKRGLIRANDFDMGFIMPQIELLIDSLS